MVRHCAIPECKNNDQVALCHRFPKRKQFLEKWRRSLALDKVDPAELFNRYVVCTMHFQATDYRNSASRMLNLTAVPTLNVFRKGDFYDPLNMAQSGAKQERQSESIIEETEIEVLEMLQVEPESTISVETTNPVDEEFEVYYIEEETKNNQQPISESLSMEVLQECPLEKPPPAKRNRVKDPQPEASLPKITLQDVAVQTDDDVECSKDQLERQLVAERYSEYVNFSRFELAKELAELKAKLAHIEAAHAVMQEAFKSIMS